MPHPPDTGQLLLKSDSIDYIESVLWSLSCYYSYRLERQSQKCQPVTHRGPQCVLHFGTGLGLGSVTEQGGPHLKDPKPAPNPSVPLPLFPTTPFSKGEWLADP